MDHDLPPDPIFLEEHRLLREQLRKFIAAEVAPRAEAWEERGMVPREVLREMGQLGHLGLRCPEDCGGSAMDARASVVLAEELGRSGFSGFAITVLVHTDMATPHLLHAGDESQKARWLPGIIAGDIITAVAMTEPGAGSDLARIQSRARREGDHYLLNGSKIFITNGVHADLLFVAARTSPDAKSSQGLSMFAIERGTPGFSVGRALKKHGWLASDTAELFFEDCRVPAENLVGAENRGFYALMANLQNERLVLAAMAIGEALKMLDITLDYTRTRNAFGGPLWDKQVIRQRLASLAGQVEAGRQLVYSIGWRLAHGQDCTREVSMAKAYCGELVNAVAYDCVQFHGGIGYMRESMIERMSRDVRIQSIGGGATEVMLEEVAKRM